MSTASTPTANPSDKSKADRFGQGIWFALQAWPALTVAIQSQFGGPDGADKRDWLAGAIADIFVDNPATDQLDVETILLQVMEDEFEVRLEDESEVAVAHTVMKIHTEIFNEGKFTTVDAMEKRWVDRRGKGPNLNNVRVVENDGANNNNNNNNEDDDDDVYTDEDDGEEVDMDAAPPLVPAQPKEKPRPEVDEDGFTKVIKKRH